ncbi:flagellar protein FlgN [Syntrophomonas erecta]
MDKLLVKFIEAINQVNNILDQLAELSYEKQQLIVLGQVRDLDRLLKKEGPLLSALEKKEEVRFQIQQELADQLKAGSSLSARELLEMVPASGSSLGTDLEEAIKGLDYNITRLKAINSHNNELIEQSLDYIDYMQVLLEGDRSGTYSQQGQVEDQPAHHPRPNLLDKKV